MHNIFCVLITFFFPYADLQSTIAFIETNDLLDFNNQNRNLNMIRYRITVLCVGDSFGTKCKDDLTDLFPAEAQGKNLSRFRTQNRVLGIYFCFPTLCRRIS